MKRYVLTLALLCLIPWVVPANGLPSSVLKSIPLAQLYWGKDTCGKLRVIVSPLNMPSQPNGLFTAGYTLPLKCLIVLNPAFIENVPDWLICEAVLHEYGHITGHHHVLDVRKIMFRQLGRHHYPCRSRFTN